MIRMGNSWLNTPKDETGVPPHGCGAEKDPLTRSR
jgi:hypothetical protein